MAAFAFIAAVSLLLLSHFFRIQRWEQFIRIYEHPSQTALIRALSIGYLINFIVPFHAGDIIRSIYAGKRMKNGIGFALATVIVERFLDVIFVAVAFVVLYFFGGKIPEIWESALFYWILASAVILFFCFSVLCKDKVKNVCRAVCSIFNDTIKLNGMYFFWSLINAFKDIAKINYWELLKNSLLMWGGYLASYCCMAVYLTKFDASITVQEIFLMLFSRSTLNEVTIQTTGVLAGIKTWVPLMMALYILLPLLVLLAVTCLPYHWKQQMVSAISTTGNTTDYLNLLPQIGQNERLKFLDRYFYAQDKEYMRKFIDMNRNISIIRDYSAGSNATTMLCMDSEKTFYRKYAFGDDGEKLREQLEWLEAFKGVLPLCDIIHKEYGSGFCCYDMQYSSNAVGMFQYIHSNPLHKSEAILEHVLNTLNTTLYRNHMRKADRQTIEKYITAKVIDNLKKIQYSRQLRELWEYETIEINGRPYKNLSALHKMFDMEYLLNIFRNDIYSDIHGDLTIENIICRNDREQISESYYIIDPNTGNIHESLYLDYGKLLQSLHGGYEFLMMTPTVTVNGNKITFISTRSSAYDGMLEFLKNYLKQNYSEDEVRSIFYHEVVHWLRLMPYKIKKDGKRAPLFYAGLVTVCNNVWDWFGDV